MSEDRGEAGEEHPRAWATRPRGESPGRDDGPGSTRTDRGGGGCQEEGRRRGPPPAGKRGGSSWHSTACWRAGESSRTRGWWPHPRKVCRRGTWSRGRPVVQAGEAQGVPRYRRPRPPSRGPPVGGRLLPARPLQPSALGRRLQGQGRLLEGSRLELGDADVGQEEAPPPFLGGPVQDRLGRSFRKRRRRRRPSPWGARRGRPRSAAAAAAAAAGTGT